VAFVLRAFLAALAALSHPTAHDGFQAAQRDGVVVFSRQVDGRFRLIARRGGRDTVLPVAPSRAPFDVELAPVPGRGLVVAFSRCRARGSIREGLERRGCRLGLVRADGRGGEQRLGPRPRPGLSYRYPALQGRRLAYMRVPDSGGRAEVVVEGRVVLARDRVDGPDGVYGLDLARYGIAAVFEQTVFDDVAERTLLVKRPGRPPRTVALGATGIENNGYVVTPAFSGPYLYWGYANHGWTVRTRRSYVFRRDLASGARTGALLSPYVTAVAVDAGRPDAPVVVTTDDGLDSPQRLVSRQAVRTLADPTYRTVRHDDLIYP
jgi:hypothetical protein